MHSRRNISSLVLLLLAVLLVILPGCTPAATPQPTEPPAQAQPATAEPTALPPTATSTATQPPAPTEVPPTATPLPPTATATPAAPQITTWCIPKDQALYIKLPDDPGTMPEGAKAGELVNGAIDLITPAQSCSFVFDLGRPYQDGTVVELLDGAGAVWLKSTLKPLPSAANGGYAVFTHSYVVEPPFWSIVYGVVLRGADGAELWKGQVNMRRGWLPAKCWDGTLPNINTLACKKQQDLHPWDPAYTPPPPEVTPIP